MHEWLFNYTRDEDCKGGFSYLTHRVQGKFFYFQYLLSVTVSISGSTHSLVTKEVPCMIACRCPINPRGRSYHHHFTDEETKAQSGPTHGAFKWQNCGSDTDLFVSQT